CPCPSRGGRQRAAPREGKLPGRGGPAAADCAPGKGTALRREIFASQHLEPRGERERGFIHIGISGTTGAIRELRARNIRLVPDASPGPCFGPSVPTFPAEYGCAATGQA